MDLPFILQSVGTSLERCTRRERPKVREPSRKRIDYFIQYGTGYRVRKIIERILPLRAPDETRDLERDIVRVEREIDALSEFLKSQADISVISITFPGS